MTNGAESVKCTIHSGPDIASAHRWCMSKHGAVSRSSELPADLGMLRTPSIQLRRSAPDGEGSGWGTGDRGTDRVALGYDVATR